MGRRPKPTSWVGSVFICNGNININAFKDILIANRYASGVICYKTAIIKTKSYRKLQIKVAW